MKFTYIYIAVEHLITLRMVLCSTKIVQLEIIAMYFFMKPHYKVGICICTYTEKEDVPITSFVMRFWSMSSIIPFAGLFFSITSVSACICKFATLNFVQMIYDFRIHVAFPELVNWPWEKLCRNWGTGLKVCSSPPSQSFCMLWAPFLRPGLLEPCIILRRQH